MTLRQTNKASDLPIVLFDQAYWEHVVSFEGLVAEGMVEPEDLSLFGYANSAEEAWSYLVRHGLKLPAA